MKKLYLFLALFTVVLASCTKEVIVPVEDDVYQWMQTHEKGTVAYVDRYGNYIVETLRGYSVVEPLGSATPLEYDTEYAYFSSNGSQSSYNYDGDYFTRIRVISSRLSWSEALYVIDHLD